MHATPHLYTCSVCCCCQARPVTALTATALLQRALLHHTIPAAAEFSEVNMRKLLRKRRASNLDNDALIDWLRDVYCGRNDPLNSNITYEYCAKPFVLNVNESGSLDKAMKCTSEDMVKNLCVSCEKLTKAFARHEQMCHLVASKLLKVILKSFINTKEIEKPNVKKIEATVDEGLVTTVIFEKVNDSQQSVKRCMKEILPDAQISVKRKRGRPRKIKTPHVEKSDHKNVGFGSTKSKCPFCFKLYSINNSFVHNCLTYRNSLHCKDCNVFSSSYVRFEKHLQTYHQQKKRLHCLVANCNQKFISKPAFTWHSHFHTVESMSTQQEHFPFNFTDTETCSPFNENDGTVSSQQSAQSGSVPVCSSIFYEDINAVTGSMVSGESSEESHSTTLPIMQELTQQKEIEDLDHLNIPGQFETNSNYSQEHENNCASCHATLENGRQPESHAVGCPFGFTSEADIERCTLKRGSSNDTQLEIIQGQEPPAHTQLLLSTLECSTPELNVLNSFSDCLVDKTSYTQHIIMTHKVREQEYQCPVCEKSFVVIKNLIDHLNRHDSNEICKCSICFSKLKNQAHSTCASDSQYADDNSESLSSDGLNSGWADSLFPSSAFTDPNTCHIPSRQVNAAIESNDSRLYSTQDCSQHMLDMNVVTEEDLQEYSSSVFVSGAGSAMRKFASNTNCSNKGSCSPHLGIDSVPDHSCLLSAEGGASHDVDGISQPSVSCQGCGQHFSEPSVLSGHLRICSSLQNNCISFSTTHETNKAFDSKLFSDYSSIPPYGVYDTMDNTPFKSPTDNTIQCSLLETKVDEPFIGTDAGDENFIQSTENLSVIKALEGSGGNSLTPIEHLIGSVDEMDYFT